MDKVEVFYFRIYDARLNDFVRPERMSTRERIEQIAGAEIVATSGLRVPVSAVDADGRYDPRSNVPEALFP